MTPWLNIALSAAVAVVATLSIEYAAKPRLDARKERILERARLRREVEALLNVAHSNYGMYADFILGKPSKSTPKHQEVERVLKQRLKAEIGEQALEIVRYGRLLAAEDPLFFEVVSIVAGTFTVVAAVGLEHVDDEAFIEGVALALALLSDRRRTDKTLRHSAENWIDEALPSRRSDPGRTR